MTTGMPRSLLHLFEEQRRALWDKEKKRMAAPVGWTGCGQWEAEAQVRKWEEERRLEKATGWPTALLASGLADGWESRIPRGSLACCLQREEVQAEDLGPSAWDKACLGR